VAVINSSWQNLMLREDRWVPVGEIESPYVDDDPVLQILQEFAFGYFGPTLIRKSFLERIGGVKETPVLGEDIDVMLRIAMSGGGFRQAYSAEPTFFYRDTPNSLCQFQVKHLESVQAHYRWLRNVEAHLRARGDGQLSELSRDALVRRYSRFLDFLQEYDQDTFREVMQRIRQMGVAIPPFTTRSVRLLARFIGYQNAMQMRSLYRMRPALTWR
jgi:GT2 family glycosyltransferase